ncbi:uncharacterized protein LOC111622846 [Centruroides sculpturatus]|uniref:uncharacterized protein LOC111622846 n=1 Tax=Centruroides sculpturatus TaxID=218467 RepID=UPI000C6D6449|nr:uncharacterized protein LOC111622846 [Centruroides sculpturatus]
MIGVIPLLVTLFHLSLLPPSSAQYFHSKSTPEDGDFLTEESSSFAHTFGGLSHKHGTFWDGWMKGWFDGLKLCSEKHGFGGGGSGYGYSGPLKIGHADGTPVHHYVKQEHGAHKSYKSWGKKWH